MLDVPGLVVDVVDDEEDEDVEEFGSVLDVEEPGSDDTDPSVLEVTVDEGEASPGSVVLERSISGAPGVSLTCPEAAATTHQAARVTSTVAKVQPRAYRVIRISTY